ncbi:GDSL esterase/lipase At5g33370-like [Vicia villosa]|uniref:GDSL esterase/lipase At5g33370-like n=1 Tax=Vicia villosa TaxID=3911 RepID=UPI00273B342D|nr:GDSL esterase/lipase At5g33370-like [Vicia villosa]
MASFLVFTSHILVILCLSIGYYMNGVDAARAFFVFGDSLVDNGNNNFLATLARADAPPYGIDYPTGRPTGRFSNGLNIPDLISKELGSETTLPYLSPKLKGKKLLVGANFASAGVGILNDTGFQFIEIIRMHKQLDLFEEYKKKLSALIGDKEAIKLVNGALVLISCGGNDFVNNYYLVSNSLRSRQYDLPKFVNYLITEYKKILRRLYKLGARRVVVTGTGPMGCVPAELARRGGPNNECSVELERAASLYNPELFQMIIELNREKGSDVFVVVTMDVKGSFENEFVETKEACCGQGPYNGIGLCTLASNICQNREDYLFWDSFHPSEKANKLIVEKIMTASTEFIYPMNLSTILALDSKINSTV